MIQSALYPHFMRIVNNFPHPYFFQKSYRRNIDRMGKHLPEVHLSPIVFFIILRRPESSFFYDLPAFAHFFSALKGNRSVKERRDRVELSSVNGCCIGENLKGRSCLTMSLGSPVELTFGEVSSSHQGFDESCVRVHSHQSSLEILLL
ncbi:hypothetical protein ES703_70764 [subsurface metagenome]